LVLVFSASSFDGVLFLDGFFSCTLIAGLAGEFGPTLAAL